MLRLCRKRIPQGCSSWFPGLRPLPLAFFRKESFATGKIRSCLPRKLLCKTQAGSARNTAVSISSAPGTSEPRETATFQTEEVKREKKQPKPKRHFILIHNKGSLSSGASSPLCRRGRRSGHFLSLKQPPVVNIQIHLFNTKSSHPDN